MPKIKKQIFHFRQMDLQTMKPRNSDVYFQAKGIDSIKEKQKMLMKITMEEAKPYYREEDKA